MTRTIKQRANANYRRFSCLLLTFFLLWTLPGCGSGVSAPEFPPTEEMVQSAAAELGWILDSEGTQSWAEDYVLYALETEDQTRVSVSCALVEGNRFFTETCVAILLLDKPQFAWESWEEAVTLAETLYGNFSKGELYQILSEQDIPNSEIPPAEPDTPAGQESLSWEVELPTEYVRVRWSVSAGTVEHTFPSPTVQDWRITFNVSLYASKETYESMCINSQSNS